MRGIWPVVAILTGVALLISCASSSVSRAPEPAKSIDISRIFSGRWFEIARTPMKLTDGCVAGTTDFYRRPDGVLMDRDACRQGSPDGKERTYQGPVTISNPDMNSKFVVNYVVWGFISVPRTYWILDHDKNWFIVSDPEFKNVSVFTRSPRPGRSRTDEIIAEVQQLGYDTGKLEFPTQFPSKE
jgi:apolipoprotein D and lipocalin family protein